MRIVGRTYVLFAAISLVAMVSRAGWINWPVVGHFVAVILVLGAGLLTFLALVALLVGIPTVIIIAVAQGLLKLVPTKPTLEPVA
jgi:hypothetical protein